MFAPPPRLNARFNCEVADISAAGGQIVKHRISRVVQFGISLGSASFQVGSFWRWTFEPAWISVRSFADPLIARLWGERMSELSGQVARQTTHAYGVDPGFCRGTIDPAVANPEHPDRERRRLVFEPPAMGAGGFPTAL